MNFIIFLLTLFTMSFSYGQDQSLQNKTKQKRGVDKDTNPIIDKHKLTYHYKKSDYYYSQNHIKKAVLHLDSALLFSPKTGIDSLLEKRALYQFKRREYDLAISDYSTLIDNYYHTSDNLYQRANCYYKQNKKQKAVNDLKNAMKYGNKEAEKLHEKINPEKRRVVYYITRCCDGSQSSSKGRGACSHHGGVCNWNEPVYEYYREYK